MLEHVGSTVGLAHQSGKTLDEQLWCCEPEHRSPTGRLCGEEHRVQVGLLQSPSGDEREEVVCVEGVQERLDLLVSDQGHGATAPAGTCGHKVHTVATWDRFRPNRD